MFVAVVGAGLEKFDSITAVKAQDYIRNMLTHFKERYGDDLTVISGGSPMLGADQWAEDIAKELNIKTLIFRPEVQQWNPVGKYGYKRRNQDIAQTCDVLYNIVVAEYPKEYKGYCYTRCYHCKPPDDITHKKSGGCYTMKHAAQLRKEVYRVIL